MHIAGVYARTKDIYREKLDRHDTQPNLALLYRELLCGLDLTLLIYFTKHLLRNLKYKKTVNLPCSLSRRQLRRLGAQLFYLGKSVDHGGR